MLTHFTKIEIEKKTFWGGSSTVGRSPLRPDTIPQKKKFMWGRGGGTLFTRETALAKAAVSGICYKGVDHPSAERAAAVGLR